MDLPVDGRLSRTGKKFIGFGKMLAAEKALPGRKGTGVGCCQHQMLHPVDPFVDIALCNMTQKSAAKRIITKLLRHPLAMLRILRARKSCPTQSIRCTDGDLERLSLLLAQKKD